MKITLNGKMNDGCFIQCQNYDKVEYGSSIDVPPAAIVYVFNKTTQKVDNYAIPGIINLNDAPKLFKKIDRSGYLIYYISTSRLNLEFGDNVSCNIEGIDETIYYNVSLEVFVEKTFDINRTLELLSISTKTKTYPKKYVENAIYKGIKDKVLGIISKHVQSNASGDKLENFNTKIDYSAISKELSKELWDYSLDVKINKITVSEQEDIKAIKQDAQLKKWQNDNQ